MSPSHLNAKVSAGFSVFSSGPLPSESPGSQPHLARISMFPGKMPLKIIITPFQVSPLSMILASLVLIISVAVYIFKQRIFVFILC